MEEMGNSQWKLSKRSIIGIIILLVCYVEAMPIKFNFDLALKTNISKNNIIESLSYFTLPLTAIFVVFFLWLGRRKQEHYINKINTIIFYGSLITTAILFLYLNIGLSNEDKARKIYDDQEGAFILGKSFLRSGYLDKSPEKAIQYFKKYLNYEGKKEHEISAKKYLLEAYIDQGMEKESFDFVNAEVTSGDEVLLSDGYFEMVLGVYFAKGEVVKEDLGRAFTLLEFSAEKGHRGGEYNLGVFYRDGLYVKQDYKKAKMYFLRSAENGDERSKRELGSLYGDGLGVKKDFILAKKWFLDAVDGGDAWAMYRLGLMHENGMGMEKNNASAFSLYERAAKNGIASSQYKVFDAFYRGSLGVTKDLEKSYYWAKKAALNNHANAMNHLGQMYFLGQWVEQDYQVAREWFLKSFEVGEVRGAHNLGFTYDNGLGVDIDYIKAREWYEKAVKGGNVSSYHNLALLYLEGQGVDKDYIKARELFEYSSENGGPSQSYYFLGAIWNNGLGVDKDLKKAHSYFLKSAEKGYVTAMNYLAGSYYRGTGVKKDLTKAHQWFKTAAEKGSSSAQYNLGLLLQHGQGTEKDLSKAIDWYEKAAQQDHQDAMSSLGWEYLIAGKKDIAEKWLSSDKLVITPYTSMNLGHIYLINGDQEKALELYKKSLDMFKDNQTFFEGYDDDYQYLKQYGLNKELYLSVRSMIE